MIYTPTKRYQLTLWATAERSGIALHMEFDSREEAEHAFAERKAEREYGAGILYEWDRHNQEWSLLAQYSA